MAELTLKDELVLEIGKSVSSGFNDLTKSGKSLLINPTGQPLTNNASDISSEDDFIGPRLPETPEKNGIMGVLISIRDGIKSLVETFAETLSFQKQEEKEAERADRISKDDPPPPPTPPGGTVNDKSIFTKAFEKIASIKKSATDLLSKDGIIGLLIKSGLIASLIALAKFLEKYGKLIAEALTPIVEGIKRFYNAIKDDIGPLLSEAFSIIKDTFTALYKIVKGIFNLDSEMFMEGINALVGIVKRIAVFLVDATAMIINALYQAFGGEGDVTQAVKDFIYGIANKIKQAFIDTFNFITETLPNAIGNFVDDVIQKVKDTVQAIKDFILAPIIAIKDKVSGFFGGIKDFFTGDEDKAKAEAMSNNVMDLESAKAKQKQVFDQIHEGGDQSVGYKKSEKARMKMYNAMVIEMDPSRGEDHKALNSTNPMLYADYDYRDDRQGLDFAASQALSERNKMRAIVAAANNTAPNSNTPNITPEELQKGKELNRDSVEVASNKSPQNNMQINKGGTNNVNTANNTYTNIMEDTNTSDKYLRVALADF